MTFTRFRPAACAAALALALVAAPLIPAQAAGTLDRIAETGVFTIGYRTGEPPMSFADPDGQPAGYSVDLCRVVAEEARLDLGLERPRRSKQIRRQHRDPRARKQGLRLLP